MTDKILITSFFLWLVFLLAAHMIRKSNEIDLGNRIAQHPTGEKLIAFFQYAAEISFFVWVGVGLFKIWS